MARQTKADQQKRRRYARFRDQHERRWGGEIEKETGDPCYELQPVGWRAPVMPPSHYVRIVSLEMGRVEIAYREWIADWEQRRKEWQQQIEGYCHGMYGDKAGEILAKAEAGEGLPAPLLNLVGRPPLTTGPIKACLAENRWALGWPGAKRPAWADQYPDWPFNRAAAEDDLAKFRDAEDYPPMRFGDPSPEDVDAIARQIDDEDDAGEIDGGEDGGAMAAAAANAGDAEVVGARSRRARPKP